MRKIYVANQWRKEYYLGKAFAIMKAYLGRLFNSKKTSYYFVQYDRRSELFCKEMIVRGVPTENRSELVAAIHSCQRRRFMEGRFYQPPLAIVKVTFKNKAKKHQFLKELYNTDINLSHWYEAAMRRIAADKKQKHWPRADTYIQQLTGRNINELPN